MKYVVKRNPNLYGLDSIFNDLFAGYNSSLRTLAVNILDNEKSFVIEAEVPGYKEDNISLSVENHVLKISSVDEVKTEEEKKEENKYIVREVVRSSFERSFTLPEGVDEDNIKAEYSNGILTVTLPKVPKAEPKKIEVKINK